MAEVYSHRQVGYVTWASLAVGAAIVVWVGLKIGENLIIYIGVPISLVLAVLSGSMTVRVTTEELCWNFGLGFWKKQLPLSEIDKIEVVRNSWVYGWGIHLTPHGWLYNVSGFSAIQVNLKNGKSLRIGTDEPEALKQAFDHAREFSGNRANL